MRRSTNIITIAVKNLAATHFAALRNQRANGVRQLRGEILRPNPKDVPKLARIKAHLLSLISWARLNSRVIQTLDQSDLEYTTARAS